MKFSLLASGSKGNCCVIEHKGNKMLIDCGTTKRYLNQCFDEICLDIHELEAVLITHQHSDHVSQIKMFNGLPIYATQMISTENFNPIIPYEVLYLDSFTVTVLPMSHDCEGTVGFVIECDQEKLVYVTDTGYIPKDVYPYIRNADYYIFESNHDIEMLMNTNRPIYLKQRIISDSGHLCNEDCARILTQVISQEKTKEIVLAHISQEGNTREKALNVLLQYLEECEKDVEGIKCFPAGQFEIYTGGNDE